jgi:protein tyrosine phosphatase (PTP) superfamily phosphohydrolase (DUF442 family)
MPTFTWWINDPLIKGSGNPTDDDLAQLHGQGFRAAVSLLEENKQPPRYDKHSAETAGWTIYSIPIEEGRAPSLQQVCDFTTQLKSLQPGAKFLVFCESGLGRTAFMGAAYWVNKGLSANDVIARVSQACRDTEWVTDERRRILDEYEQLTKG